MIYIIVKLGFIPEMLCLLGLCKESETRRLLNIGITDKGPQVSRDDTLLCVSNIIHRQNWLSVNV